VLIQELAAGIDVLRGKMSVRRDRSRGIAVLCRAAEMNKAMNYKEIYFYGTAIAA
jgi:hypothetical protein